MQTQDIKLPNLVFVFVSGIIYKCIVVTVHYVVCIFCKNLQENAVIYILQDARSGQSHAAPEGGKSGKQEFKSSPETVQCTKPNSSHTRHAGSYQEIAALESVKNTLEGSQGTIGI